MDYQQILLAIRNLPATEQSQLINELTGQSVRQDYISVL